MFDFFVSQAAAFKSFEKLGDLLSIHKTMVATPVFTAGNADCIFVRVALSGLVRTVLGDASTGRPVVPLVVLKRVD